MKPETGTDNLPPHSPEGEQGVLGCALLSPQDTMNICVEKFRGRTDMFYELRHQTIWNVLRTQHEKQEGTDTLTVYQRLRDQGVVDEVGGLEYLMQLQDGVPSAANLPDYIAILQEKYLRRCMYKICGDYSLKIFAHGNDAASLAAQFEQDVSALTESQAVATEEHIGTVMRRVVDDMEQHYQRGSQQLRGLPTGPEGNYLDKIIRGVRDKYYFVVAGRPAGGKTSWAMNMVEYLACDYVWTERLKDEQGNQTAVEHKGIPVAVFSIEMDPESLGYRLLFGRANVDSAQWSQGFASEADQARLVKASAALAKSNIYIDASPAQTIGQIAAKARRMVKQYGIKLFVLDYLQLVEQEGGNGMDRVRELTKISRKIMALKKQLGVPWMVLAQMNRNIETSEVKRIPVLSDLKDCGAIEQDADLIMFLYKTDRKELKKPGSNGGPSEEEVLDQMYEGVEWSRKPVRVDALVAKNRFGPTGVAKLLFQKNLCRFVDWHMEKVRRGAENLKQGERRKIVDDELD